MGETIEAFRGEYRFLSNYFLSDFTINNVTYTTVEHYYQSQKCTDAEQKQAILNAKSPSIAKSLGARCKLRSDWERIKLDIMEKGLNEKFGQNKDLLQKLLDTKDAILEEGNDWNDKYWGVDIHTKEGKNYLGKLIMKLRDYYYRLELNEKSNKI